MSASRPAPTRWLKPLVAWAGVAPLAWLVWGAATDALGANPAEALIRSTGEWSLRFQHFSNGRIKNPNPGENFLQFRYTHRL